MHVCMRSVCMSVCITMHTLGEAQSSTPLHFSELPPSSGKQSLQLCLVPSGKEGNGRGTGNRGRGGGISGRKEEYGQYPLNTIYKLPHNRTQHTLYTEVWRDSFSSTSFKAFSLKQNKTPHSVHTHEWRMNIMYVRTCAPTACVLCGLYAYIADIMFSHL